MTDSSSRIWDQAARDFLLLTLISGVGPRLRHALLDHFGSASEVLQASRAQLVEVVGVGRTIADRIHQSRQQLDVDEELAVCRTSAIDCVLETDARFPSPLTQLPDPPGALFVKGEYQQRDQLAIAIVGTRHATRYGIRQAEKLASGLSRYGFTIVSGMARGIDAAAHRATMECGGRTIAVLGSGLLNLYPPEHESLAREVACQGCLMSELPPRQPPMSGTFPQRNRLISGLSLGVLVVEAAARSGALISAQHAAEQGREVFAIPGRVDSRTSRGCHQLLRDGAKLVETVDDVLEELGPLAETISYRGRTISHPGELQLNEQERVILDAIESTPTSIDQVATRCRIPIQRVLATISVLEMRHYVQRQGGHFVSRR